MKSTLLTLIVALLMGAVNGMTPAYAAQSGLSILDKQFLQKSAQSNLGELLISPMVIRRAPNASDTRFARRMIRDHTHNQDILRTVAAEVGATIPADTSKEEKGVMNSLRREPQRTFPSAYRQEMIRDHTIDIAECRREISLGRNLKVRRYAMKTLPVLKMHLAMAKRLPTA